MRFITLLSTAAFAATAAAQVYPLSLVYQFENAFSGVGYTNVENIALRTSNGQLLLNTVTGAILAQLNPNVEDPQPELILNITDPQTGRPGSLTGIAETKHDVFTVAAGSFRFGPSVPGGVEGINGSFSVWNFDLNHPIAQYELVTAIPEAGTLNGLTAIPNGNKDLVLIADSILGAVWVVNVKTGEYKIAFQSDLFLPSATLRFGINGVKVQGRYLYFTNSAQSIFGGVPIDLETGLALTAPIIFAQGPNTTNFDDFSFKPSNGNAFIATQPNAVYEVSRDDGLVLVAGGGDDETLFGPTSTAFGEDGCTLYITTGGQGGPMPQSGQIFALDTCEESGPDKKMAKRWVA